jgi:hypothetical protein
MRRFTVGFGRISALRRQDSPWAQERRERDFRGVLQLTCIRLGLRTEDVAYYEATEFGLSGECHAHFLVAKEGLRDISGDQFAKMFTHLWMKEFRPDFSENLVKHFGPPGLGLANIEPYDPAFEQRGVNYCLKREFDSRGQEQERYERLSRRLFNILNAEARDVDSKISFNIDGVLAENPF